MKGQEPRQASGQNCGTGAKGQPQQGKQQGQQAGRQQGIQGKPGQGSQQRGK